MTDLEVDHVSHAPATTSPRVRIRRDRPYDVAVRRIFRAIDDYVCSGFAPIEEARAATYEREQIGAFCRTVMVGPHGYFENHLAPFLVGIGMSVDEVSNLRNVFIDKSK